MKNERCFSLLVAALATWRLTHLLALEDGPGDSVVALRLTLGDSFFGQLMDCFYCLSLWVAAPMAFSIRKKRWDWPFACLAISGAACLLEKATSQTGAASPHQPVEEQNELLR
jgi:hypothetical protein